MKDSNDTIGNRTRDLPACSAVPQPTAPPGAQYKMYFSINPPPRCSQCLMAHSQNMFEMVESVCYSAEIYITDGHRWGNRAVCFCA